MAAVLLTGRAQAPTRPHHEAADLRQMLLTFAPDSQGEPVKVDELTARAVEAWVLRQRARYEALAASLPPLLITAQTAATYLQDDAQVQATHVLVHTYNAASSLLKRLGDTPLALVAADRAVQHARTLDDPTLIAASLYRTANVLLTADRLEESEQVALAATSLVDPAVTHTPRGIATWGGLLLTAAVASARRGLRAEAWELMGEARSGARMLGTDHADFYAIFGPTNVAIHGVQVAVELGEGHDAVRRSVQVDYQALPPSLIERRGQYLLDLASAHALAGDDAEACATLRNAQELAPQEVRHNPAAGKLINDLLQRGRTGAEQYLRDLANRSAVAE